MISVKLRIRTSSSQFILAEDHNVGSAATAADDVAANDSSTMEKKTGPLENGGKMKGKEGEGGSGRESTAEPMDTEEKQTCKQHPTEKYKVNSIPC